MKKLFIVFVALTLLLGISTWASAISPPAIINFWAVDSDGTPGITLGFTTLFESNVQYSLDNIHWSALGDTLDLTGTSHVFLQLQTIGAPINTGDMVYKGPSSENPNYYNSLLIKWQYDTDYTFITHSDNDKLSPVQPASTPIPSAIWLLGAGMVGLVGVRRKLFG